MTKEEIIEELKERGFTGYDSLNKPELEKILKTAQDAKANADAAESQKALNAKLNAKLNKADATKQATKFPEFKLGKDTYQLVVPSSTLDKQVINKDTLEDDSPLLKQLVKIKSGVIRKK